VGPEKVNCGSRFSRLNFTPECRSPRLTEERKFGILFVGTILAARKLIDMDPNKPNMAKEYFVFRGQSSR
jgi:hypothetical protein